MPPRSLRSLGGGTTWSGSLESWSRWFTDASRENLYNTFLVGTARLCIRAATDRLSLSCVELSLPSLFLDRRSLIADLRHGLHLYREPTVWSTIDQDACADLNTASGDRRLDDSLGVFTRGPIPHQGQRKEKGPQDA
jgi:hypothetical protein